MFKLDRHVGAALLQQVFVVHPAQPHKPELVATFPQIKGIGIAAGRLIVLSRDGTLTALGAS